MTSEKGLNALSRRLIPLFWLNWPFISIFQIIKKLFDLEEDASVDDANEKTLTVPADTPLAYNVCELYVMSDGAVELIIDSGCRCVLVACTGVSYSKKTVCVSVCIRLWISFIFSDFIFLLIIFNIQKHKFY